MARNYKIFNAHSFRTTLCFTRRAKRTYSNEWHYNYERLTKIEDMVLKGHAIIQLNQKDQCMLANIAIDNYRAPTPPLNESTVIGPQEGFVEDIDTNINLVRKRLPVLDLQTKR